MNFIQTLQGIRDGALVALLGDKLQDVITSVGETGKAASLQLTLKVVPNGDRSVRITSDVKAKTAEPGVGDAIFFHDDGGNLLRRDPRQTDIEDELQVQRDKKTKSEVN